MSRRRLDGFLFVGPFLPNALVRRTWGQFQVRREALTQPGQPAIDSNKTSNRARNFLVRGQGGATKRLHSGRFGPRFKPLADQPTLGFRDAGGVVHRHGLANHHLLVHRLRMLPQQDG